ncbi:hypothetical protein F0L74_01545 [Chitinophaga agrisoli]|uniref:Lipoprotein n=1 Tax=Chitinophaga agrisoli TaxID=2607653 RepID=A0A5B2W0X6_9BACT|nr:hypothetical protein [Chitinophaga agrisoli]KAA2244684.1 hypothetical protein F0L74_01545 [Chitinophaga agrisoli]
MTRLLMALAIILTTSLSCNYTGASGNEEAGVMRITGRCAVFYTPGRGKMGQLKRDFGEKSFQGIADANQQYMNEARQFLTSKQVKILNTSQFKLEFVKTTGEVVPIDLNRSKYAWEIFLFNGFDDPVKIDMTNIEDEYRDARMGN